MKKGFDVKRKKGQLVYFDAGLSQEALLIIAELCDPARIIKQLEKHVKSYSSWSQRYPFMDLREKVLEELKTNLCIMEIKDEK